MAERGEMPDAKPLRPNLAHTGIFRHEPDFIHADGGFAGRGDFLSQALGKAG